MSVSTASNSNIYKIISDSAGLVGIGTTSPEILLHVKGYTSWVDQIIDSSPSSTGGSNFTLRGNQNSWSMSSRSSANGTSNNAFSLYESLGNAIRMVVLPGGNVGIGHTTPGSTLDVKGTLRLSGSTSGYVGFSPAAAAGSTTYTLPAADGSASQVLTTNGSGVLSWVANGSGAPATLSATNAWTGVNSFAAQTTTSRLMGNTTASGYPFDLTQNGTVSLSEAIGAGNIASTLVNTSTSVFPTFNTFAYINTYGTKATGIGFHAGTSTEVLRVASSLSMTSYTKWQNVNAVVVGYLNNGPRVVIQDYDLMTQQSNTIRLTAENVVIGETATGVGGVAYAGIRTIADVATTLDHTSAYILLGGTGAYTITLPSADTSQGVSNGRWYLFKKITATNVVTIAAASGQTIDGAASVTISTQWSTLRVLANGASGTGLWYTV